jgi:carboxymethylenebutenolidase
MRQIQFVGTLALASMVGLIAADALVSAQEAGEGRQQLTASPRHHEWAKIKSTGGRTVRAYVVYPEVDRPATAVVVIHENRGLNDWARSVADKLAGAGYVAIAPDLLSGKGPGGGGTESFADSDAARTALYELSPDDVLYDLNATVEHIRKDEATNKKVAVVGFCWGGGQAFRFAAENDQIAAAMVFYGPAPEREHLEKISVPVYGFYGGNDFRITGAVPQTTEAMKQLNKKYEPVIYEGAGHGFLRSGEEPGANDADNKAHQQGWARLLALLKGL